MCLTGAIGFNPKILQYRIEVVLPEKAVRKRLHRQGTVIRLFRYGGVFGLGGTVPCKHHKDRFDEYSEIQPD